MPQLTTATRSSIRRHHLASHPSGYEVLDGTPATTPILLQRRDQPLPETPRVWQEERIAAEQWVEVPTSDQLLYVDLDLRMSLTAALGRIFLPLRAVQIELAYRSGKHTTYHLLPETARNGLLVNHLPTDQESMLRLLQGRSVDEVKAFRISGPGVTEYDRAIGVTWWTSGQSVARVARQASTGEPGSSCWPDTAGHRPDRRRADPANRQLAGCSARPWPGAEHLGLGG